MRVDAMLNMGRLAVLLPLLVALTATGLPTTQEEENYRLDGAVRPSQYKVRLEPDLEKATFHGTVTIEVKAEGATDAITMHAQGITFRTISVISYDDPTSELYSTYETVEKYEFLVIKLTKTLEAEKQYTILIDYDGTLRNDMYGFYISRYIDDDNKEKIVAATQFEATHARKAFPCFDEPSYKARFQVTIVTPEGYHSLNNMPVEKIEGNVVTFKNSVIMPVYLVAFVVSDFESLTLTKGDITFTTWARKEALPWAEYSMDQSPPLLRVLEEYMDFPYLDKLQENPIVKVEQVALPDFAAGAMENWGLITYRETALLYNDGTADARKRVATVIAHELLHSWFGNLVTTKWWDTTWLNEGFARYFQYYAVNKVERDWRMWDQFLVDQQHMVFALDAISSTYPLTQNPANVQTPAQASASFGTITYSKGGCVLRMLTALVGEEPFQSVLRNYLKERAYRDAVPDDLFDQFKIVANEANLDADQMGNLLNSWTEQPGFPVVEVSRNYEQSSATLHQERFMLLRNPSGETEKYIYDIPLTWVKQGESFDVRRPQSYLRTETGTIEGMPDSDSWVIFNVQETGYYRVNYDEGNWKLIIKYLNQDDISHNKIHLLNRAQLLDDAFNLARVGLLSYQTAFDLADYLAHETDYIPWAAAITVFTYLERMLNTNSAYSEFQKYILQLLNRPYQRYSFQDAGTHIDKLFLNRVTTLACSLGLEECTSSAEDYLNAFVKDKKTVPADLRSIVYCNGVRNDPALWESLWTMYQNSKDDAEKSLIATGLGCSNDAETLQKYLGYSLNENYIRRQDASSIFTAVYVNPFGVNVALDFLDKNFEDIQIFYGSMGAINNIVSGIAGRLTTEEQRDKLKEFVNSKMPGSDFGQAAVETVNENLRWLGEYESIIIEIVKKKNEGNDDGGGGGGAWMEQPAVTLLVLTLAAALALR